MRIVTWNATGDTGESALLKKGELEKIIEYWKETDPVVLVCLQEVNASNGWLTQYLRSIKFKIVEYTENANDKGKNCVIAAREDIKPGKKGKIYLDKYYDCEEIPNKPPRSPVYVDMTIGEQTLRVITWHATLGSRQREDFENFSDFLSDEKYTKQDIPIIIAADFNQTEEVINEDYYNGFTGYGHHLDYIIGKNVDISDGAHNEESASVHLPISAHFSL